MVDTCRFEEDPMVTPHCLDCVVRPGRWSNWEPPVALPTKPAALADILVATALRSLEA